MKKRIGFITENYCPSKFKDLRGYFVNKEHPNFPGNPDSPNYPRAKGRVAGFQNPILGDPGRGEIARWYTVRVNALQALVEQMIEQFVRDRNWYSKVRCREALWNMYRRLQWWVAQNIDPSNSDYKRALSFIRDCINQILDTGEVSKVLYSHNYKDGMDYTFEYYGGWEIDEYGYLKAEYIFGETVELTENPEEWYIKKIIEYPNPGLITFNYAVLGYAEVFELEMDGEVIWSHGLSHIVDSSGFTFRDITLNVPAGIHEFKWKLIGDVAGTIVRISEIVFTELYPEITKPDEVPKCPLPYIHHYSSDYMNYFTGVPYERPTFSTIGSSKISDYLDMIRYVSSTEDIEWVLVNSVDDDEDGDEIIFKLPLERLPETLSSKMTFNWRLKRKGYITFKYWIDGGNGSTLSFYINNQLVGGPWRDTDGWQEVRFNMSQSQTYKFDFLVHKESTMNVGRNAVFIKDIQVVEVTDYTDEPMPGDYYFDGEEAEAKYGKWLIYSDRGVLGSYYRGFPDGAEDTVRELELEFYSECDGIFSFAHRLGTLDPDRFYVEGLVFTEQHTLNERPIIWDGEVNGVGIPTVTVTPKYSTWKNTIPDGYSDIDRSFIWTKDSDSLIYHIKIDGDWDKGVKFLNAFGRMRISCPPRYVVETNFLENINSGEWVTSVGDWQVFNNETVFIGDNYGYTIFRPHSDTSIVSLDIDADLRENVVLNIYLDGQLYRRIYPGLSNYTINIPNYGGDIKFEIEQEDLETDDEKKLVFVGIVNFDGDYKPIERETMYYDANLIIDAYYENEDGRGRRVIAEFIDSIGSLETPTSWFTSTGINMTIDMLPDDEVVLTIPNIIVPYIDYDKLERLLEEYRDSIDIGEGNLVFSEDFNPFINQDRVIFDSNWQIVDVFEFLNIQNWGDSVIAHEASGGPRTVEFEIDLEGIELTGRNYLKFEYGALFNPGDYAKVIARTKSGDILLKVLTNSTLKPYGYLVQGIEIPSDTKSIVFSYTYGGGN